MYEKRPANMCNANGSQSGTGVKQRWAAESKGKILGNGTLCLSFPLEFSDEDGREAGERLRRKEGMKTPKKKQNLSLVNT